MKNKNSTSPNQVLPNVSYLKQSLENGSLLKSISYFQMTKEDIEIGHIEQVSRGLCTDVLTDTNSFHVEVPTAFDPGEKALVIGATILLVSLEMWRLKQPVLILSALPRSTLICQLFC